MTEPLHNKDLSDSFYFFLVIHARWTDVWSLWKWMLTIVQIVMFTLCDCCNCNRLRYIAGIIDLSFYDYYIQWPALYLIVLRWLLYSNLLVRSIFPVHVLDSPFYNTSFVFTSENIHSEFLYHISAYLIAITSLIAYTACLCTCKDYKSGFSLWYISCVQSPLCVFQSSWHYNFLWSYWD